ncbi:MAG: hypothetical protein L7F78_01410 [Syntrophales bacterium LBB04]|nr:hypothetical protein [Syntrophales bacterium LBB04]
MTVPVLSQLKETIKRIFFDAGKTSLALFKIMVPIIILVKIIQEAGLVNYLAIPLAPVMELVGLPAQTGLVWATAMANTIYSGIIVYLALLPGMPVLSVAQITVLSTMILIAHNLPLEARITQKCGVSFWGQVFFRLAGALLCGLLMHLIFKHGNFLSQPSVIVISPPPPPTDLMGWAYNELIKLPVIFTIILTIMAIMRLLNYLKITNLFLRIMGPVLRLMGISQEAGTITVIGLTMGIAYGGGLIINEASSGKIDHQDIFFSVSFMGLSHALIEDTILMTLLGASTYGVFWGRLLFTLVVMAIMAKLFYIRQQPAAGVT